MFTIESIEVKIYRVKYYRVAAYIIGLNSISPIELLEISTQPRLFKLIGYFAIF